MCHCCEQKVSSKVYEKLMIENAKRHSEIQKKRVVEGKHNWSGGKDARKRVAEGNHNFQNKEKARSRANKRVAEGRHNLSGPEHNKKRLENGNHPSQIKRCALIVSKNFV